MSKTAMSHQHHMPIPWLDLTTSQKEVPVIESDLQVKSSIIGRVGIILLSCGTGAWRVRDSMNQISRTLGVSCTSDVGLTSIQYTCIEKGSSFTQVLSLPTTGVNTDKLNAMEHFVRRFVKNGSKRSMQEIHQELDTIEQKPGNYPPLVAGLAAGLACCAFVFLLGGGPVEMLYCFLGAGLGNFVRRKMLDHHLTVLFCVAVGVLVACLTYLGLVRFFESFSGLSASHEAGYIGAMLFVIPGFPFITSGLDIAKVDMRSGLERLAHALTIILVATLVGWVSAAAFKLAPHDFVPLNLSSLSLLLLRIPASFCGVFGFSMMFNSPEKMAATAGLVGAAANTLRLELVDLAHMPAGPAAFCGALTAGLLASFIYKKMEYPRIALTVPAIVIMVPGLYMYRAMYNMGIASIGVGALWLTKAALIVLFLPLGLMLARIITDKKWRYCN